MEDELMTEKVLAQMELLPDYEARELLQKILSAGNQAGEKTIERDEMPLLVLTGVAHDPGWGGPN